MVNNGLFYGMIMGYTHLVMTFTVCHGKYEYNGPFIEIDGLPFLKMGGFSMANC